MREGDGQPRDFAATPSAPIILCAAASIADAYVLERFDPCRISRLLPIGILRFRDAGPFARGRVEGVLRLQAPGQGLTDIEIQDVQITRRARNRELRIAGLQTLS